MPLKASSSSMCILNNCVVMGILVLANLDSNMYLFTSTLTKYFQKFNAFGLMLIFCVWLSIELVALSFILLEFFLLFLFSVISTSK